MPGVVVGEAVRNQLLRSLSPMVRAIGTSLGPDGRAVLAGRDDRVMRLASGVAIAREVGGEAGVAGVARRILTETLVEAERDLGDGTARLAVMAEAAFRAGVRQAEAGIDTTGLVAALAPLREEVARRIADELCDAGPTVALARAAGADPEQAEALAAACEAVGPEGTVEIVAGRERGVVTETGSGFLFEATAVGSPLPPGETLEQEAVHVLAADDVIDDFGRLAPVIDGFAARRKPLLIVARDVGGSALAALERNREAGVLSVTVVKPTVAGPRAAEIVEDLAIATGAALVAERSGLPLSALRPAMLGRADLMRVRGGRIELRGPGGDAAAVTLRTRMLEDEIRRARYLSLDREHAERRRARLLGRWAEIRLAGALSIETEARVATGRSALASLRSALRSGAVPGGGHTLARVAAAMSSGGGETERAARRVVAEGLRSVGLQLDRNAGRGVCESRPDGGETFVRDPLRLTQLLIDQALSVAGLLLRVDAVVLR